MTKEIKELYFSPQSIESKALEMLQSAKGGQRSGKFTFHPDRSALLVLDMQSYFLDESSHAFVPSGKTIIPRVNGLIDAFNKLQRPIIFTRHINTVENSQLMTSWWREIISSDHPLSRIVPELDPMSGFVVEKSQYDAFFNTNLEDSLRDKGVKQVVISGVMTHLCCETTARSAFMRGFEVFFLVDGTATYNETFHRASLTNLSHGFAELKLAHDILSAFQGSQHA